MKKGHASTVPDGDDKASPDSDAGLVSMPRKAPTQDLTPSTRDSSRFNSKVPAGSSTGAREVPPRDSMLRNLANTALNDAMQKVSDSPPVLTAVKRAKAPKAQEAALRSTSVDHPVQSPVLATLHQHEQVHQQLFAQYWQLQQQLALITSQLNQHQLALQHPRQDRDPHPQQQVIAPEQQQTGSLFMDKHPDKAKPKYGKCYECRRQVHSNPDAHLSPLEVNEMKEHPDRRHPILEKKISYTKNSPCPTCAKYVCDRHAQSHHHTPTAI